MALPAYLTIVAERQGLIRGSGTQKGREGKILIVAIQHEIVAPRNPHNGLPTGKRAHKPFLLTKEVDRSSPLLYQVLCTNENLPDVRIEHWTTTPLGHERQHYTVRLTNANISAITFKLPNVKMPKLAPLVEYEKLSITYEKITWTWNEGGITATDDWETSR